MNGILLVLILIIAVGIATWLAYVLHRRKERFDKGIERGLKMVPLLIYLPPSEDKDFGSRDLRDVMKEKVSQAEIMYDLIAGTAKEGFKSNFYGQRHLAFEIVAAHGLIHFYAAVPVVLVEVVKGAIISAYPGARIEEAEDHNLFSPIGKLNGTTGGELILKTDSLYPIATIEKLEHDPMSAMLNALGSLSKDEGVGIQIMIRPANPAWSKGATKLVKRKRRYGSHSGMNFTPRDFLKAVTRGPEPEKDQAEFKLTNLEEQMLDLVEKKTQKPGYEVLIRVVVSANLSERAQIILNQVATVFALFNSPGLNGFKFLLASDISGLVTAFIFRFFPPEVNRYILNSTELATLFHLPDAQFTPQSEVKRQHSKQVDGPASLPQSGLLMGYNFFRGDKKEIRLSPDDRRRHVYIVGQTGTGKSTLLENMMVQDMQNGGGFAFIDPHGDTAEKILSFVPKERAEDVVYFNPADMEFPLGLNLFEFSHPSQKDFLINESINMLYKLYDPNKTGIIGPRFEQWFRNAALTLMADPNGSTYIEVPKVFTDTQYLKQKFRYLTDPTVIDFWTKEMAQTSDYHKSEMLGYFTSKFGALQSNEMMRNIIGQKKSAFNLRDIMDNKKILIVNLSKGLLGDINSSLLGMIFVMKFQAAAMSRADMPEAERKDFGLYVDEFQNFSTDSFASILSEARKYRLNLIVANQFIGQLSDPIRDAVFGNVGSMISYRTGPEDAEFLVKQFAPAFDARDLVNLPNYNAAIKLMIAGLPTQPFSITALAPLGTANKELALAIKQLSASKYGKPKREVEKDIFERLSSKPALPAAPMGSGNVQTQPVSQTSAPTPPAAVSENKDQNKPPVPTEVKASALPTQTKPPALPDQGKAQSVTPPTGALADVSRASGSDVVQLQKNASPVPVAPPEARPSMQANQTDRNAQISHHKPDSRVEASKHVEISKQVQAAKPPAQQSSQSKDQTVGRPDVRQPVSNAVGVVPGQSGNNAVTPPIKPAVTMAENNNAPSGAQEGKVPPAKAPEVNNAASIAQDKLNHDLVQQELSKLASAAATGGTTQQQPAKKHTDVPAVAPGVAENTKKPDVKPSGGSSFEVYVDEAGNVIQIH